MHIAARWRGGAFKMLVARYFFFVGAALIALLFLASAELPKSAPMSTADMSSDLSAIRIKTDRKWPAPVVFDTRIPETTAVQTATITAPVSTVAEATAIANKSVAELAPSEVRESGVSQPDMKSREIKRPVKRKIAKRRVVEPTVLAARQGPFGFFTDNIW